MITSNHCHRMSQRKIIRPSPHSIWKRMRAFFSHILVPAALQPPSPNTGITQIASEPRALEPARRLVSCCLSFSGSRGEGTVFVFESLALRVLELDCLRGWETLELRRGKAGAGIVVGTCISLPQCSVRSRTSRTAKNVPRPLSRSFRSCRQNLGVPFSQGSEWMHLNSAPLLLSISARTMARTST